MQGGPGLVAKSWRPAAGQNQTKWHCLNRSLEVPNYGAPLAFPDFSFIMEKHGDCPTEASIDDSDSFQGFENMFFRVPGWAQ